MCEHYYVYATANDNCGFALMKYARHEAANGVVAEAAAAEQLTAASHMSHARSSS